LDAAAALVQDPDETLALRQALQDSRSCAIFVSKVIVGGVNARSRPPWLSGRLFLGARGHCSWKNQG
jgi:hypothetical protein